MVMEKLVDVQCLPITTPAGALAAVLAALVVDHLGPVPAVRLYLG